MLVALEGIDGSGKSTIIKRVAAALKAEGLRVHATQEPTDTWLGQAVRKGISAHLDPMSLAFLFLSDRAEHVRDLQARDDDVILTDRYRDSTTAYQAVALATRRPDALDYFRALQDDLFPAPDLAILLDVPAELGVQRIASRTTKEPFEKIAFLRRVRSNYLRLAKDGRMIVVDGQPAADVVAEKVLALVRARLAKRPARIRA